MFDVEKKLIKSVKSHACLYDKSNSGFRNRQQRDRAWAQVSAECGLPVKQSQCRWKTLRDRFVREYHKRNEDYWPAARWHYFDQISFLQEHIKPRGCGNIEDSQLEQNDETIGSYSSELQQCKSEDNGQDALSEASSVEPAQLSLHQAQQEFVKVMGLLEQKLNEQPGCVGEASAPQDPFYKYLESILSRVDEAARADIQLELLNVANTLVKNAKATEQNVI